MDRVVEDICYCNKAWQHLFSTECKGSKDRVEQVCCNVMWQELFSTDSMEWKDSTERVEQVRCNYSVAVAVQYRV
jgi:hypothetical protein